MGHELEDLATRVRDSLGKKEEGLDGRQEALERKMEDLIERRDRFNELAAQVFVEVVQPRMGLLREFFENTRYQADTQAYRASVSFDSDNEYLGSFKFEVSIGCDQDIRKYVVVSRTRIVPILMDFEREASISLPVDGITREDVATFVNDKILLCVDTYLRFQNCPHYKRDGSVVDPVCGMSVQRKAAGQVTLLNGSTYYFCSRACQEKFSENPLRFTSESVAEAP